jgi:cation:H+ antiporter
MILIWLYAIGLIAGLSLLWFSGDKSVQYSIDVSNAFHVTKLFIGFVFIAVATGIPELSVVLTSLMHGVPHLSAGDIIGSNFCDISMVLGFTALFVGRLYVRQEERSNILLMFFVTTVVMAIVFFLGTISWPHGLFFVLLYFICLWWLWRTRAELVVSELRIAKKLYKEEQPRSFWYGKWGALTKLAISLLFVLAASQVSVFCAIKLAHYFEFSLSVIGATIFAVGTSLPELSLGIAGVRRKEYGLVFGNIFGSVLEQGTLLLGLLAIGAKEPLALSSLRTVAPFMLIAYAVVANGLIYRKRVGRIEGAILLLVFFAYLFYHLLLVG